MKKILITVVVTVLATVIIVAIPFYFLFVKDVEKLEQENQKLKSDLVSDKSPEPTPAEVKLPEGPKLVKNTAQGKELILQFSNQYDVLTAWKDWLFVGDKNYGTKDKKAQVWAYNIKTDVKKKIFDFGSVKEEITGDRGDNFQYVNNLQVFNDRLFISLGGYLMKGYIYEIDLDEEITRSATLVGETLNPTIEKYGDIYLVQGGEGDAGCANYLIQSMDINKMNLSKVYESSHCVGDGQDLYFGTDGTYLYLAGTIKNSEMMQEVFAELKATKISDPKDVQTIISKSKMPKNVHSVKIGKNYLVLLGDSELTFYANSNSKLSKIGSAPYKSEGESMLINAPGNEDVLCTFNEIIDLKNKTIENIPTDEDLRAKSVCNIDANSYMTESSRAGTVVGVIEQLKKEGTLPAEFEYLDE